MQTLKDKKVVVVGGAGFIGSNLAHGLLEEGAEVHVIDNLVGGKREKVPEQAVFHEVDIRNVNDLVSVFEGADSVFHLAALPRVQFSIDNPIDTNEVNITGTLNVLVAAQKTGVRRVVYSASSSAYGDQKVLPLVETMHTNPLSPYGLQKYVGEQYMRVFNAVHGIETVSLRYFNIYGPGLEPDGSYALVVGKFLKQRQEGKTMTITGTGEQTRDFTHVTDAVRANILAATSDKVGKGDVINIGAGNNQSIKKIAEMIGGPIEFVPARFEPSDTLADNTKAKQLLGWEPTVSIEEGIAELKKIFNV